MTFLKSASFFVTTTLSFLALSTHSVALAELRVGLVLDRGGKDDKSFNSAAFQGVTKAEKELKMKVKVVEATDDNAYEPQMRALARAKFDLIIGVGFSQIEAVKKVSAQFPDRKFAIVDGEVAGSNVRSLLFEEHEGSFLVGALAAMKSATGKIGFIGGMDIPLIRRFQLGFEAGAKHINPKIQVQNQYAGVTGDAWNNPPKGKELALSQYAKGNDIIFAAAGATNSGVFDAAEEKKKLAIGVDSNQNWMKPGFILTSMLKRVDVAVFKTCEDVANNKFTSGVSRFGLANKGIDYSLDEHNQTLLTKDMISKVDGLKKDIIAGKIKVPDFYKIGQKK